MKRSVFAIPALIALIAAGCGSSDDDNGGGATGTGTAGGGGIYSSTTGAAKPPATAGGAVIKVAHGTGGVFLTDAQGRTLYVWAADTGKTSTCTGACADGWPPLTTNGTPKGPAGTKASLLGTTKRSDGTLQVTFAGHPLYRYAGDTAAGQTNGQGSTAFGALWSIVGVNGKAIKKS